MVTTSCLFAAILSIVAATESGTKQDTLEAKIRDNSNLSQFYHLLEDSPIAKTALKYRHVTVFAPTNVAFQQFNGSTKNLVLYHILNLPKRIENLRDSLSSEFAGNPPLWVTRRQGPHGKEEVYINNAKILAEKSNYESKMTVESETITQVLHVINEVLEPVRSMLSQMPIDNPDAFEFLNQSDYFELGDHRLRTFRQRVTMEKKEDVFKAAGRYTFLMPVEEGFKPEIRPKMVDRAVIDGHVIPNQVLFTGPTPDNVPYETLAFPDNLKVTVSFLRQQGKVYVKSNTLVGDANHTTGVVLAEIVKANIPVRNGVVHLIQRPLMVVDTTVRDFLEEDKDGPVYKFYQTMRDFGDEIMTSISQLRDVTLFAPSNAALEEDGVKEILQDKKRVKEILKLHYVKERLPLERIKDKSVSQTQSDSKLYGTILLDNVYQEESEAVYEFLESRSFSDIRGLVPTAAERKKLYFDMVQGPNGNQTVTVEGGGVNATVINGNIAATNGFIHIIDRVLGVPYTTVYNKLRTDPMLNKTFFLGHRHAFNDQLNDTKKRFTYFAPSDHAWTYAATMYASTTKKLFMPDFAYHTRQILERHLVVSDQPYTMARLKEMNQNGTIYLTSVRDTLKLRVKEYSESYQIEWKGKWIKVLRPDVECTNGIIHVIENVLLMDSDVWVTGSASMACLAPHLIMLLIAKWLL